MSIRNEREVLLCLHFDFVQYWRGTVHCIAFSYLYILRRRVEVSIPDEVIEFFHRLFSGRTMALTSNQPLTEMSTRGISWGKGGWCVELTILTLSHADFLRSLGVPGILRDGHSLFVWHAATNNLEKKTSSMWQSVVPSCCLYSTTRCHRRRQCINPWRVSRINYICQRKIILLNITNFPIAKQSDKARLAVVAEAAIRPHASYEYCLHIWRIKMFMPSLRNKKVTSVLPSVRPFV
jgi:hypothetical protein